MPSQAVSWHLKNLAVFFAVFLRYRPHREDSTMALTDATAKAAKPRSKPYKMVDEKGLGLTF
jgi:hypothetical protein